jgi:NADH-quinone oxidoreductase subunit E
MKIPVDLATKIEEAISHYPASKRSASLPLLHLWQGHFGFVSDEAINWIAAKLELTPVNILELVTFYPMFRRKRAGRRHIRVCRTLSCQLAGSYELRQCIAKAAGVNLEKWAEDQQDGHGDPVAVSADGRYSIEFRRMSCLVRNCAGRRWSMIFSRRTLKSMRPRRF